MVTSCFLFLVSSIISYVSCNGVQSDFPFIYKLWLLYLSYCYMMPFFPKVIFCMCTFPQLTMLNKAQNASCLLSCLLSLWNFAMCLLHSLFSFPSNISSRLEKLTSIPFPFLPLLIWDNIKLLLDKNQTLL